MTAITICAMAFAVLVLAGAGVALALQAREHRRQLADVLRVLVARNAPELAHLDRSALAAERIIEATRESAERRHLRAQEDQRYEHVGLGMQP